MTRIAIIGNAGGGKSVLARQLGGALDLPVHVIDDIQWQPGWKPTALDIVAAEHTRWLAEPAWVIDGWGAWDLIERRFAEADTIILVDFPLHVHMRWALKRHFAAVLGINRGWPPAGCRALPITRRLLQVMRAVDSQMRPRLLEMVTAPGLDASVYHLRSPRELRRFREQAIRPGRA